MLLLLFPFTFLHNCPILLQLVTDAIPDENVDERTSNGEGVFSFCNTDRIFVIVSLSIIYHSDIHTKLSSFFTSSIMAIDMTKSRSISTVGGSGATCTRNFLNYFFKTGEFSMVQLTRNMQKISKK